MNKNAGSRGPLCGVTSNVATLIIIYLSTVARVFTKRRRVSAVIKNTHAGA